MKSWFSFESIAVEDNPRMAECLVTTLDALRRGGRLRGEAISMRVIDVVGRATLRNEKADEVLYILERDTGIFLPAGAELELEGKLTVVGVASPNVEPPLRRLERRLESRRYVDVPVQRIGDRWYRELIQNEITQFVGSIPPGRAPDHFHLYEEVLCILQGSGFMWAGKSKTPIAPGSCVLLPKRQVHCLENTGSGELRLLGVFYPAGSPAVRYGVDQRAGDAPGESKLDRGD
jgi:mannose-6-phosphate isomerase-like protein (cupin superfamily)